MRRFPEAILGLTITVILVAAVATGLPAQPSSGAGTAELTRRLHELVPGMGADELIEFVSNGEIVHLYAAPESVRFAPAFSAQIAADLETLNPGLGVELMVLQRAEDAESTPVAVTFRILQSIGTMEGIEYYSASRGRVRTLYFESFVIGDPDSREPLPDPVRETVPDHDQLYVYQRDSTFGRNVYDVQYDVDGKAILLTMRNLTPMLFGGLVPAIGQESLVIHIIVLPVGDYLLFYGASAADPVGMFGMEERARDSFYNRVVALRDWFLAQRAELTESDR